MTQIKKALIGSLRPAHLHRKRSRVLLFGGALIAGMLSPTVSSPAAAHTCAAVIVWIDGSSTPLGSCHFPGDPGDVCHHGDKTVSGYGVDYTACVWLPVASPD